MHVAHGEEGVTIVVDRDGRHTAFIAGDAHFGVDSSQQPAALRFRQRCRERTVNLIEPERDRDDHDRRERVQHYVGSKNPIKTLHEIDRKSLLHHAASPFQLARWQPARKAASSFWLRTSRTCRAPEAPSPHKYVCVATRHVAAAGGKRSICASRRPDLSQTHEPRRLRLGELEAATILLYHPVVGRRVIAGDHDHPEVIERDSAAVLFHVVGVRVDVH